MVAKLATVLADWNAAAVAALIGTDGPWRIVSDSSPTIDSAVSCSRQL